VSKLKICVKKKFVSKVKICAKNQNLCQKSKFVSKIKILVKNQNCWPTLLDQENFLHRISICAENLDRIWTKISIFSGGNYDFGRKNREKC